MRVYSVCLSGALSLLMAAGPSFAAVCDYRLSHLVGRGGAAATVGTAAAVAGSGPAMGAAGLYLITNATTGMVMIGSTAAGASAAGTVGIIAGTHGILGGAAAVVSAPLTAIAAGVAAIGAGGLEAACYFQDERITDPEEVFTLLEHMAAVMPRDAFQLYRVDPGVGGAFIRVRQEAGEAMEQYFVENLYVVNGTLMHRDWGLNTVIGTVLSVSASAR